MVKRKYSKKRNKKISETLKGRIPWNKGLTKETDERIKKTSEKNTSRKVIITWGDKISKAKMGHVVTEKTRKKISNSKKGCVGTFIGKKHTEKAKEKNRQKHLGKKLSVKNRIKLSNLWKTDKYQKIAINNGLNTLEKLKKSKISKAELKLKEYLRQNNMKFIHQYRYKLGMADFYLPEQNLIIECDGEYWHSLPGCKERDERQTKYLQSQNFNVLRLSSEEIMKHSNILCLSKLNLIGGKFI